MKFLKNFATLNCKPIECLWQMLMICITFRAVQMPSLVTCKSLQFRCQVVVDGIFCYGHVELVDLGGLDEIPQELCNINPMGTVYPMDILWISTVDIWISVLISIGYPLDIQKTASLTFFWALDPRKVIFLFSIVY